METNRREENVKVLNTLVEINNDRIEGYNTAAKETKDADLQDLFWRLQQTSEHNNLELKSQIIGLGGEPTEDTKTSGKFFRAWMDLKSALSGNNREVILNSCEFGEEKALDIYHSVIAKETEHLTHEQKEMINMQANLLKKDHNTILDMKSDM